MSDSAHNSGVTWLNGDAWRDGETPPGEASMLHDRGFVLGDGLFETLIVRNGKPVLWQEHLDRLAATTRALHFPLPEQIAATAQAAAEAVLAAAIPAARDRGALRITLTRGGGTAFGLDAGADPTPTLMVRLTPASRRSRAAADREAVWIVDQPRIDPHNVLSGHKTTSSMWRVVAHETARKHGADLALMKTLDGDVGEADTACVFVVIDGDVVTPPLDRGILPSTTRAFVLAKLAAGGHSWNERRVMPEEFHAADEVILTSSVTGIRAVGTVDGHQLPAAAPISEHLDTLYENHPGSF